MRLSLITGGASALALLACPALAQDTDWTGPYLGVHAGAGFQSGDDDETILFDTDLDGDFDDPVNTAGGANAFSPGFCGGSANANSPAGGCEDDDEDWEFGVRAGYDWRLGQIVVGGLVEASHFSATDSVSAFSTTPASYTMTRELNWMAAARARAGVPIGRFMPYVTAGAAWADVERNFATTNGVNTFVQRDDDSVWGWQLGAGGEFRVTDRFSLGLEYLSTSLNDGDFRVRAQGPAPATNPFILVNASGTDFAREDDDFDVQSLRLTASMRF